MGIDLNKNTDQLNLQDIVRDLAAYRALFESLNPNVYDELDITEDFGLLPVDSVHWSVFAIGVFPILQELQNKGLLEGKIAVDLGSEKGVVVYALRKFFKMVTYGIEMYSNYVAASNKTLVQVEMPEACTQGNIFIPEFQVDKDIKWGELDDGAISKLQQVSPYETLGIKFEKIELFYLYQFNHNVLPIIKMISEFGKPGALIICAGPDHLKGSLQYYSAQLPENIAHLVHNEYADLLQVKI